LLFGVWCCFGGEKKSEEGGPGQQERERARQTARGKLSPKKYVPFDVRLSRQGDALEHEGDGALDGGGGSLLLLLLGRELRVGGRRGRRGRRGGRDSDRGRRRGGRWPPPPMPLPQILRQPPLVIPLAQARRKRHGSCRMCTRRDAARRRRDDDDKGRRDAAGEGCKKAHVGSLFLKRRVRTKRREAVFPFLLLLLLLVLRRASLLFFLFFSPSALQLLRLPVRRASSFSRASTSETVCLLPERRARERRRRRARRGGT